MSRFNAGAFLEGLTSRKGVALVIPAVLLLAASLSVGQRPYIAAEAASPSASVLPPSVESTAAPLLPVIKAQATVGGEFSADQKKQIEAIIKDYLIKNPEVMVEVQAVLESKMEKIQGERMQVALKENAADLFRSTTAPVAGNPKGDVTVVEFFDYNCGYCKKALPDLAKLADKDKNVKIVLKEFPILSKGSEEAAKVALAAKMQGKYWEFHRAMLESQGQANEASALKVAEKVGLNMAKIKTDMASPDVKKEIDGTRALAQKMGIQGTPHFLVGEKVIPGAPEGLSELLLSAVAELRKDGGCKVC